MTNISHMNFEIEFSLFEFPGGSDGKASAHNAGDLGSIPGSEDPLEEEMATHSSTVAWKAPWMEQPNGLQSMEAQRVGHDRATSLSLFQRIRSSWDIHWQIGKNFII